MFTAFAHENIASRYKKAYGAWPPMDVSQLPGQSELRRSSKDGRDPNRSSPFYSPSKWGQVIFLPCFPKRVGLDAPVVLDDALSPGKRVLLESLRDGSLGPPEERKLLLKYLATPSLDIAELLDSMLTEGFRNDELVCAMKSKEREMKA